MVFRADAAFAKPEIYEALEESGVKYAIRIPAVACSIHGQSHGPESRLWLSPEALQRKLKGAQGARKSGHAHISRAQARPLHKALCRPRSAALEAKAQAGNI
ncbi:MAG: hypothetical protein DMG32_24775 [Acidobacteria bacterium]|nr:MAG: hypothetical protein DMG32_24775 [Acidobacteriota bacterium]